MALILAILKNSMNYRELVHSLTLMMTLSTNNTSKTSLISIRFKASLLSCKCAPTWTESNENLKLLTRRTTMKTWPFSRLKRCIKNVLITIQKWRSSLNRLMIKTQQSLNSTPNSLNICIISFCASNRLVTSQKA